MSTTTSLLPEQTATPLADERRPAPQFIDNQIQAYEALRDEVEFQKAHLDDAKQRLLHMIAKFGYPVPGSEQSRRIAGALHAASAVTSNSVTVNPAAASELELALAHIGRADLFGSLFIRQTKFALVEGASDAIRTAALPGRLRDKIEGMFGKSFEVRANAPSLKCKLLLPDQSRAPRKPRAEKGGE